MYFLYGEKELAHLKERDPLLGRAIDEIGMIQREVDPDLFSSVVHHIIGQQISTAAQATVWRRLQEQLGVVNPEAVACSSREALQRCGMTFKKVEYIQDFAQQILAGTFDLEEVAQLPVDQTIQRLCTLKGVGVWTAEMILIFCLQRPDVVSFGDLAIQRGMRMLYHHRAIDCKRFQRYARRYSPYGTVASLYLWAIAGGAIPGMRDYAIKKGGNRR